MMMNVHQASMIKHLLLFDLFDMIANRDYKGSFRSMGSDFVINQSKEGRSINQHIMVSFTILKLGFSNLAKHTTDTHTPKMLCCVSVLSSTTD
jgi:hypothetical protein